MLEIGITGPFSDIFCGEFKAAKFSYYDAKLAKCASFCDSAIFSRQIALIWLSEKFRLCFGVPN